MTLPALFPLEAKIRNPQARRVVEIVTRNMQPVQNLFWTFEFVTVVAKLKNLGVKLTQGTYVQEIGEGRVTVFDIFTNVPEAAGYSLVYTLPVPTVTGADQLPLTRFT